MSLQFGWLCETAVRLDARSFFRLFEVFVQPFAKL
jgi:hypothetical protein